MKSEKQSDRAELLQLCEGLRFLRLPASSTEQVCCLHQRCPGVLRSAAGQDRHRAYALRACAAGNVL